MSQLMDAIKRRTEAAGNARRSLDPDPRTSDDQKPQPDPDPRQAQDQTQPPTPDVQPSILGRMVPTAYAPEKGMLHQVGAAHSHDDDFVTVLIPKDFKFTTDDGKMVEYKAGIDEMPRSHAGHWFSKAQGVEIRDE